LGHHDDGGCKPTHILKDAHAAEPRLGNITSVGYNANHDRSSKNIFIAVMDYRSSEALEYWSIGVLGLNITPLLSSRPRSSNGH
jgi:hypothetical protein